MHQRVIIVALALMCCNLCVAFRSTIRARLHKSTVLKLGLDIPLIPAIIGTGALVFGIFNLPENNIDLTDVGIAKAKQKRRQERIASGDFKPSPNKDELDPYRFRIPIIDDDDEDLMDPSSLIGKKKGGGCG